MVSRVVQRVVWQVAQLVARRVARRMVSRGSDSCGGSHQQISLIHQVYTVLEQAARARVRVPSV